MKAVLKAFLLLVVSIVILGVATFIWLGSRGVSAKAQPGRLTFTGPDGARAANPSRPCETAIARTMRHLAVPRGARDMRNPVEKSADVIKEGMAHYADHCAACHVNDGSGETEMGLGLYPKPPDMRLPATQSLTDGELFYIVENGVRLTGMPAWSTGTEEGRHSTWHLVHFIRELPRLTSEQINEMKGLNPRSPEEIRQQIEEEKFLQGGNAAPPPKRTTTHQHIGAHK